MALKRVLEPEVMDTVAEAEDYDAMDHSEVNELFATEFLNAAAKAGIDRGNALDVGTGTAQIPIEIGKRSTSWKIQGIDLAKEMLKLARVNIAGAKLQDQIEVELVDAKKIPYRDGTYDAVISNSIVHHIPEPEGCVREMVRVVKAGGLIFVRDLMRPENDQQVDRLVETYAGGESEHAKKMFDDSLRAALSLDEIREIVSAAGFDNGSVTATSDRHWTWVGQKFSV